MRGHGKEKIITVPYSKANLAFDFGNTIASAAYFRGESVMQISTTPVTNPILNSRYYKIWINEYKIRMYLPIA